MLTEKKLAIIKILINFISSTILILYLHALGVLGWTLNGYLTKDKAIMTNFGFQIPIFLFGIINFLIN